MQVFHFKFRPQLKLAVLNHVFPRLFVIVVSTPYKEFGLSRSLACKMYQINFSMDSFSHNNGCQALTLKFSFPIRNQVSLQIALGQAVSVKKTYEVINWKKKCNLQSIEQHTEITNQRCMNGFHRKCLNGKAVQCLEN